MTDDEKLMSEVLEALLTCTWSKQTDAAIAALRERLAQPVRESYVHPISGRTADELWQETGRLRSELADLKARQQDEYKGWYCAHCQRGVDGSEVTYHEQHAVCGRVITYDVPPKAQQQQEPVASCQHKRYSVDVHEQTGRCFDCGAEGRMRFVVGNIAPVRQPVQDPVAWLDEEKKIIYWHNTHETDDYHGLKRTTPLYTAPQPHKPLTDAPLHGWQSMTTDELVRLAKLAAKEGKGATLSTDWECAAMKVCKYIAAHGIKEQK